MERTVPTTNVIGSKKYNMVLTAVQPVELLYRSSAAAQSARIGQSFSHELIIYNLSKWFKWSQLLVGFCDKKGMVAPITEHDCSSFELRNLSFCLLRYALRQDGFSSNVRRSKVRSLSIFFSARCRCGMSIRCDAALTVTNEH